MHTNKCSKNHLCDCVVINRVEKIKYLGIIVDQYLKWEGHIIFLNKKIRNIFYKFFQLRDILSDSLLRMLYHSLIESHLKYGNIIWGCAYKGTLRKLEVSQNAVLKIIFKKPNRFPTDELYNSLQILNIRNLYVHSTLNYLNKFSCPINDADRIYSTRSAREKNINVPFKSTNITQRFVTYYGPTLFNRLPPELKKDFNNIRRFKSKTKQFLLSNPSYFNSLF